MSLVGVSISSAVRRRFVVTAARQRRMRAPVVPFARHFSDRLMGYSPMAPSSVPTPTQPASTTTTTNNNIPTAADVTTAGGVWAPTSAKRDKIAELKAALAEIKPTNLTHPFPPTLDDLATPTESLDLYLVDGLHAIAATVDATASSDSDDATPQPFYAAAVHKWMLDIYKEKEDNDYFMTQHQYEDYLKRFLREMERHLAAQTAQDDSSVLRGVRDFVNVQDWMEQLDLAQDGNTMTTTGLSAPPQQFQAAVERYRLLLAQAAAQVLLEDAYKPLTTVDNADIDRAAVQSLPSPADDPAVSRISLEATEALLTSYLEGNAAQRVDAWWALMDRDGDGLLEQAEMQTVCEMAVKPVGMALQALLQQALEAHPVQLAATVATEDDDNSNAPPLPVPNGWRQRRRETQHKRVLQKMFARTIKDHFVMEVEMPHRLRCIYAWANKAHQDNKIESVVVDEIAWTGRKRYVELPPKISLPEFREVQQEHFTHLDRVAAEYLKSLREDLWIRQGKGRQRAELYRDCAMFMAVVCGIDYIIITL